MSWGEWSGLWTWSSPAWPAALGGALLYALACGRAAGARAWYAAGAALLLLIAFVSPLGAIANGVVFAAHMVQHLLLLLVVPLLVLAALPRAHDDSRSARQGWDRVGRVFAQPSIGWVLGVAAMWLWHEPNLCNAATRDAFIGALRDLSFIIAGLAFWWPVAAPAERFRVSPLLAVAYLVSACLACTLLGTYVTFSSSAICPVFAHPQAHLELVARLRELGFTAAVDQQVGGLLMWVPPCLLYAGVSLHLLRRWYRSEVIGTFSPAPNAAAATSLLKESVS